MAESVASRIAGKTYREVDLCGKSYKLRMLLFGAYGDIDAHILSLRADPIDIATKACEKLPSEMHDKVLEAAIRVASRSKAIVTAEERNEFDNSPAGFAFKLWLSMRQDHGDQLKDPKAVEDLLERHVTELIENNGPAAAKAWLDGLKAKLFQASGEADVGNSTGQSEALAQ